MKGLRIVLIALSTLILVSLYAQADQWQHFTYSGAIFSVAFEGNYSWIGTGFGLVKYNNLNGTKEFFDKSNSPLPDSRINSIAIAPDGSVWFGTGNGLCSLSEGNWQIYNSSNSIMPYNYIDLVKFDAQGNLWYLCRDLSTSEGSIVKSQSIIYNNNTGTIPGSRITGFEVDAAGNLYLGYHNLDNGQTGLCTYDGNVWNVESSQALGIPDWYLQYFVHDGIQLWFHTMSDMIYSWDGESLSQMQVSPLSSTDYYIYSLGLDSSNRLLIGLNTANEGTTYLAVYDGVNWDLLNPNTDEFNFDTATSAPVEALGKYWLGTGNGLAMGFGVDWDRIDCSNSGMASNIVNAMFIDESDNIWIGSPQGYYEIAILTKYDGNVWTHYAVPSVPEISNMIVDLAKSADGLIWLNCSGAQWTNRLISFDGESFEEHMYVRIDAMNSDAAGNLWIVTSSSDIPGVIQLKRYSNGAWETFDSSNSGVGIHWVTDLIIDASGIVWISTNYGLVKFDSGVFSIFDNTNSPLVSNSLQCLAIDNDGALWIGTQDGLAKYHNDTWQLWNSNMGLPYRTFVSLAVDAAGNVWGGTTTNGLILCNGNAWTEFNYQNSPMNSDNVKYLQVDSENNIWMASQFTAGITRFYPGSMSAETALLSQSSLPQISNFPNPFNPSTTIRFSLPESAMVSLKVFNVKGQLIKTLSTRNFTAGTHELLFDGRDETGKSVASGIYYIKLTAGQSSNTKKIMLMK